uniref:Gamma-tubulin complex component n=1 Tax=Phallusia mammillata TaxID=59560 RepID=A0A6F9DV93_9ASCI|nr:gamma-tubulin complex component 5-like [Phallusia mammillata]
MSYNQKFQRKLKKLTALLISTLTDFDEGTENHESCMEFSLSNFLHHRFLEADSHKIDRQFKALSEKFFIHSQPGKAKTLETLIKTFLSNDISELSFSKSQVHYSLLNIILNLSDSPINVSYSKTRRKTEKVKKDAFNWQAYLLDGEDNPKLWGWDESPLSTDDEDTDFGDEPTQTKLHNEPLEQRKSLNFVLEEQVDDVKLVESYWKHEPSAVMQHAVHNSLSTLQSPQFNTNDGLCLTEWHLMRETLWLLSGRSDLHVFPDVNGTNGVAENLLLTHQTEKSVQQSLKLFSDCGNQVSKLRSFVFSSKSHESLTYEAFAAATLSYLKWIETDLLEIEKRVVKMEETFLMNDLRQSLIHHLRILHLVSKIYDSSVGCDKDVEKTSVQACRILGALYASLLDEWNMQMLNDCQEINSVDVLLFLWLESIQPYVEIIDNWVTCGELIDPKKEFILQRLSNVPNCQDVRFWNQAVSQSVENDKQLLPWLHPLVEKIITGGKSMEIVKTLRIRPASDGRQFGNNWRSEKLYVRFKQQFRSLLGSKLNSEHSVTPEKHHKKDKQGDILLQANFKILCKQQKSTHGPDNVCKVTKLCRNSTPLPVMVQQSLHPLVETQCDVACKDLLEIFKTHFGLSTTLEVFHNFHLMGWGDVLHDFCLSLFQDISTYGGINTDLVGLNITLQEAVARKEPSGVDVFVALKSVPNSRPINEGLLSKKPTIEIKTAKQLINVTDDVLIEYEVQWPVALVLTKECVAMYHNMFSYLMQIKRSIHSVESLKFETIYKETLEAPDEGEMPFDKKCHRLSILRAKILHLLKHWHSFIMVSVIQAEKEAFTKKLSSAQNLNEIICAHETFLKRICSLSLLVRKSQADKLVHGTLIKIMTQAISFGMVWQRGVQNISDKTLLKRESDFNECSEFLGRILKTIANRGAMPVLDSLAYAVLPA